MKAKHYSEGTKTVILNEIKAGLTVKQAFLKYGVSKGALYRWRKKAGWTIQSGFSDRNEQEEQEEQEEQDVGYPGGMKPYSTPEPTSMRDAMERVEKDFERLEDSINLLRGIVG